MPKKGPLSKETLIDCLRTHIAQGRWPEQTRLPPERRLATELGTTRGNLRQALAVLEAEGMISRHVGRGTYVGKPPAGDNPPMQFLTRSTNPMEIMEARLTLEPRLAGLAALRTTASEVAEMHRCVQKSMSAADIRTYEAWDGNLHRTIAEAAHNNLLLSMFNALNALREDKLWGQLKNATVTAERKETYSAQHRGIIEAIEARSVVDAERRMRRHLETVRDDLFSAAASFEE